MSEIDHLALMRDPRLAGLAGAALPAWLWAVDASRVIWANAVGAAMLGSATPRALSERRPGLGHPAAQQVARLAGVLPPNGAARLLRLRGFASGVGRLLTCSCARIALADGAPALLIAASEPAGPSLSLADRIARLLDGLDGPYAAFAADGTLLHAAPAAAAMLGEASSLADAGAADLAESALATGHAAGTTPRGSLSLERIGSGAGAFLLATFAPAAERPTPEPSAAERPAAEQRVAQPPAAAESATTEPAAAEPAAAQPDTGRPAAGRRQPLRFVWQTDADGRFTIDSPDLVAIIGPEVAAQLGRPWAELADALGLDANGRVTPALASQDTFSGLPVAWPVAGSEDRLAVELSGLPLLDRDRSFRGYRGFGVCRDVARIAEIAAARRAAAEATAAPAADATPQTAPAPGADAVPPSPTAEATSSTPSPESDGATPASAQPAAETAASAPPPVPERPQLTIVPAARNVVPFRPAGPVAAEKRPTLTPVERNAFQEIARALGARVEGDAPAPAGENHTAQPAETARAETAAAEPAAAPVETNAAEPAAAEPAAAETPPTVPAAPADVQAEPREAAAGVAGPSPAGRSTRVRQRAIPSAYAASGAAALGALTMPANGERAVLDRLPVGVLIYRGDKLLHANRALLDWTGFENVEAIEATGGLERLLAEPGLAVLGEPGGSGRSLAITTRRGESLAVEARLFTVPWHQDTALLLVLMRGEAAERIKAAADALRATEERAAAALAAAEERARGAELAMRAAQGSARELESVLETATDGALVVDRDGIILSSNRSAEALFGYESHEIANRSFVDLFAPESHRAAHDYLNGLIKEGVASVLNDGREVIGRVQQGGLIPLFMTIGRLAEGRFCVVFRDITQWKRAEEDLTNAKREAERASSAKSDFLAKISHEVRTPLNAIIGFAEVMMEERFGAIGNERYLDYLKDIRTSGEHVISLVNDLLDLSKIEAGKLDLNFVSVSLNEAVQRCVAIMQPQANRERIIIRTSLLPTLPPVVADERSIRQIVLNLLSNSIKFTGAGGQVIVSTALTDEGEAVLRVRDTGVGMSEKEIETALEPFRQVATAGRPGPGTGLGLPLTKVLVEANRASFAIRSAVDAGTLVEIAFPSTRVLAE